MSSFYDDASLVMIPSCYKISTVLCEKPTDGSGDLTFTRTGDTATRVNSSGLVEKVRTNLTLYSQDLTNAAYISGGTGSVVRTGNYAAAPDGTNTATRIQITRGATYQELYQRITGLTVGDEYTLSFYAKSLSGTPTLSTAFNNGYANEVTFTSSWVRYTYTFIVAPTGRAGLNLLTLGGGTSTTADILIWGVQLESGVATAYISTTTAAVSVGPVANLPRLDYLGSTCGKLLLEPQRTNLVTYSEQLNNSAWVKSAGGTGTAPSVTANNATSPDGYQNADTVIYNAGAGTTTSDQSVLYQAITTGAGSHTASFYAKTASGTAQLLIRLNSSTYEKITITNQWQRFTLTQTLTAGTNYFEIIIRRGINEPLNATATVQLWGAQVEASYATSYIPTLAASATRGAESSSSANISSLFGATEGSFYVQLTHDGRNTNNAIPVFLRSSINGNFNRATYLQFGATNLTLNVYDAGTLQAAISGGTYTNGQTLKIAFAYKANDFVLYVNGVQIGTDTSGAISSSLSFIDFGSYMLAQSTFQYDGKVSQALLFKTRLTNAQLAELTTL